MADKMDRGLDEIIADSVQHPSPAVSRFLPSALRLMDASQRSNDSRLRRPGPGDRRRERQDNYGHYPRDGVRKVRCFSWPPPAEAPSRDPGRR